MADAAVDDSKAAEDLIKEAKDEWKMSDSAYEHQRLNEVSDLKFEAGEHFTPEELAWLKGEKKPALVMDQVSGQVAKVTNQPVHRIIVVPNGGGADPKSAEYWQGICRRVENLSSAEAVYKWARRHAIVMGRGFWRVRADYFGQMEMREDGKYSLDAFHQDIRIEPILLQHSVYPDPRPKLLDFSDRRFCQITSDVAWDELKRLHKNAKFTEFGSLRGGLQSTGDCPPGWATEKMARIVERYWIEDQELTLCVVLVPGRDAAGALTEVPIVAVKDKAFAYEANKIVRENTFRIPKVKWMKYTAGEILERADVPGRYIPVVQISGERRIIDGKEDYRGMVRMAKDAQRLVDFYESRLASTVDLAAYDTWKASAEAVENHSADYINAHIERPGLLLYNQFNAEGKELKEPQHVTVAPEIGGIVVAAQRAMMNLRATLGVPDVTPDEQRPEQSGKAIGLRQREQAQATSHYSDCTGPGIRLTGLMVMSMGREIYDMPRILRINGANEKEIEVVTYKGEDQQPAAEEMAKQGVDPNDPKAQMRHMLRVDIAEFDATVSAGKGNDTARQDTVDILERVLPVLPPEMAVRAIPTLLKNVDGPGMLELAQKLEPEESGMVPAEEVDRIKQQATDIIDQAKEKIAELEDTIRAKRVETAAQVEIANRDNATKLQMSDRENAAKVRIKEIEVGGDIEKARIAAMAAIHAPQPPASPEFT